MCYFAEQTDVQDQRASEEAAQAEGGSRNLMGRGAVAGLMGLLCLLIGIGAKENRATGIGVILLIIAVVRVVAAARAPH